MTQIIYACGPAASVTPIPAGICDNMKGGKIKHVGFPYPLGFHTPESGVQLCMSSSPGQSNKNTDEKHTANYDAWK